MAKNDYNKVRTLYSILMTFDVINRYIDEELRKHGSRPIRIAILNQLDKHGGP